MKSKKSRVGDKKRVKMPGSRAGQVTIQIDGKGLRPQLEACIFKVLKAMQTRCLDPGKLYRLSWRKLKKRKRTTNNKNVPIV